MTNKIASCGHTVKKLQSFAVKGVSKEGYHILKYQSLCAACAIELEIHGLIAHTHEEEQQWLKVVDYADE